ncbi:MAG: DUF262 domain-containing protein [Planctomycetes bacterium]|jgi:hypothetical protein|nr:DUF262 domain-containing protein [Pseudomonadota bacterium]MBU4401034.1 DUF262 domain-containing protein [Planctomycetota bacterium]
MAEVKQELSIRGESIQRVYSFFEDENLFVNRKYQRKLVWNLEEKKSFIDSLVLGYPVPLFLFAEMIHKKKNVLEIIDGMQRLNAILSFIDQEFQISEGYFDLETIPETKLKVDRKELSQKFPKLGREICVSFSSYLLPFSTYRKGATDSIDEIFRRINSGGRQLSRQDIRQSGSLGNFSEIVRKISTKIRGDDSAQDTLVLNKMKDISISNSSLEYGINVDEIFWVKQSILPREKVRESRDEEIIADVLAYMLLDEKPYSNKELLDSYYGIYTSKINEERYNKLENKIQKDTPALIISQFLLVYDELRVILSKTNKQFNKLMFRDASSNVPRYFQAIFLALFELIIQKNKKVRDYAALIQKLDNIGSHINVGTGAGGVWTAADRTNSVNAVLGIIESAFSTREDGDPALSSWTTEFENILMQSFTEQSMYDFKQGFFRLDSSNAFDETAFGKYIKTASAIANIGPSSVGYLIIGVADCVSDAEKIEATYGVSRQKYNNFYVFGIEHEAAKAGKSLDDYFNFVVSKIKSQPIIDDFKSQLTRNIRLINYFGKSVFVITIKSLDEPVIYGEKYYERNGNETKELKPSEFPSLFKRFHH